MERLTAIRLMAAQYKSSLILLSPGIPDDDAVLVLADEISKSEDLAKAEVMLGALVDFLNSLGRNVGTMLAESVDELQFSRRIVQ